MTISENIENLSCLFINNGNNRVNVNLDITKTYPKRLSVYKITYDERSKYSGKIIGTEDKVEQLKKQLIHEH